MLPMCPLFKEMLKWMRDQGCYIQWYDSITDSGYISYQNHFNSTNSNWVWNVRERSGFRLHFPELLEYQQR